MPESVIRPADTNVASLRATIDDLRAQGRLLETNVTVDPDLELAGMQKRMDGGPPTLLNRVKGYDHARAVINLFAARAMVDHLFGYSSPQERTRKLAQAIRNPVKPVMVDRAQAPVQEVVVTDNTKVLDIIVAIRHTEAETEATIGSGVSLVAGRYFGGGTHVGYNRMNFRWPGVGTFQIAPGSHLWMVASENYKKGRIPITMNFGLPPAATLAAGGGFDYVSLPYGCDELGVAGAIQGAPIRLVPAATVPDAFAMADCEYVIEGYLDPADKRYETAKAEETKTQGVHPFHPEWVGYMGKAYRAPTIHVTAITHRRAESRPLIQPMIVHSAEENNIQTILREAALFDLADRIMPGFTVDVNIPFPMTDWGGAIFQVQKRNPIDDGYQRNVMVAALASSRGMRMAIAVDTDVSIYDMDDIMWALTTRVNPQTDILNPLPGGAGQTFQPGTRTTAGDRAFTGANTRFEGGLAIDATVPYGMAEHYARPRYAVGRVDLSRWFGPADLARVEAAQDGWLKLLAKTGW